MLPQLAPTVSVAFLLGTSDGEAGAAFAPEAFFVQRNQKVQYALGFELVRGASEMTRQFTCSANVAPVATLDTYAVGRQDYIKGSYGPPSCDADNYGDYLRGYNDAWAEATGRTSWQLAR